MARSRTRFVKATSADLLVPRPGRRAVITGLSAGTASLLIGCGSDGGSGGGAGGSSGSGGMGSGGRNGTGGTPAGSGGVTGSGGSAGGGTDGGGAGGSGGAGTGGAAPGSGGSGADAQLDSGVVSEGGAAPTTPGGAPVDCVVRPAQTEGPYFTDFKLNRSDIRSDPTDGSVKGGTPLRMVIRVGQIDGMLCKAFQGVMVDLWQCDAAGDYSDAGGSSAGKKFLRGYQLTDASGVVEFLTIYPGYYTGRAVHLHFKVRTNPAGGGRSFTSQLYFPDDLNREVFAQAPYASRGRGPSNSSDSIFRAGGASLIPKMTKSGAGWLGEFDLGLRL